MSAMAPAPYGVHICKQDGCANPVKRLGYRCAIHEGTVVVPKASHTEGTQSLGKCDVCGRECYILAYVGDALTHAKAGSTFKGTFCGRYCYWKMYP